MIRLIPYMLPPRGALLPNRCSVVTEGNQCTSPPVSVVSIVSDGSEYMVGVSCGQHSTAFMSRVKALQRDGKLEKGSVRLEQLRAVGTDCIRGDGDDLIMPDTDGHNTCGN